MNIYTIVYYISIFQQQKSQYYISVIQWCGYKLQIHNIWIQIQKIDTHLDLDSKPFNRVKLWILKNNFKINLFLEKIF